MVSHATISHPPVSSLCTLRLSSLSQSHQGSPLEWLKVAGRLTVTLSRHV